MAVRSVEERTKILNYAKRHGVAKAAERWGVSKGAIYNWQRRLKPSRRGEGKAGAAKVKRLQAEIKRLKTNNQKLRDKIQAIRRIISRRS